MVLLTNRKLIIISISFQLALIGLISLSEIGLDVPILRQVIGLVCLILIPGSLLGIILKMHLTYYLDKLLYIIGLSLFLIMAIGLFCNIVYPYFGIIRPLDTWSVTLTYTIFVIILSCIIYLQNKNNQSDSVFQLTFNIKKYICWEFIYILLLPFLACAGALLVSYLHTNILLLLLIILISFLPLISVFKKDYLQPMQPFAVYSIALSLLLHMTFVSAYPMRINVDGEFFYQNIVIQNSYWDILLTHPANTVLSIVILGPVLSKVLGLNSFWLFKIIYPFIFSLVPLILYRIYNKIFNKKIAFISTLFIMFIYYFYALLPLLRRQQLAILFLSLILLLIVENNISSLQRSLLGIVFSISLIVSHYTVSYIFLIILIISYLMLLFVRLLIKSKIWIIAKKKLSFFDACSYESWFNTTYITFFTSSLILIYIIIAFSWYIYIGTSVFFIDVTMLAKNIYLNMSDFLDPAYKSPLIESALGGGFFDAPFLNKLWRILQYLTQFFIILGFTYVIIQPGKIVKEYILLSLTCILVLALSILVPFLTINLNINRIYFILLVILAPFCIIGGSIMWNAGKLVIKKIYLLTRETDTDIKFTRSFKDTVYGQTRTFLQVFTIIILVPYFLFNVGFIFAIGGYSEETRNLSRILSSSSLSYDSVDTGYYTEQEVRAAMNASNIININSKIFADKPIGYDLISAWHKNCGYYIEGLSIPKDSYAFLRRWNIEKKEIRVDWRKEKATDYQNISELPQDPFQNRDKIYANGGAEIFGMAMH